WTMVSTGFSISYTSSGYNLQYNKERVLIENCEKVADGELPVTCHTCFSIWQDVHRFKPGDFDTESGKGNFTDTELTKITIGQEKTPNAC
ncbi:TPA: hypothetical protein ACI69W_005025, partial [Escherichia coli]